MAISDKEAEAIYAEILAGIISKAARTGTEESCAKILAALGALLWDQSEGTVVSIISRVDRARSEMLANVESTARRAH